MASFGGVGQAVGELTTALSTNLPNVCVVNVIPKYGFLDTFHAALSFDITIDGRLGQAEVFFHYANSVTFLMISAPTFYPGLWQSKSVEDAYNCPRSIRREDRDLYFTFSAAQLITALADHDKVLTVVHAHGASNAPVLWFLRERPVKKVYSIHDYNSETQLAYTLRKTSLFGSIDGLVLALKAAEQDKKSRLLRLVSEHRVPVRASFFASQADIITTVSSGMVSPLMQLDSSYGELLLHYKFQGRLFCLRNWVSQSMWLGARKILPVNDSVSHKALARAKILNLFLRRDGISTTRQIFCLVGWIGRFDVNKGIDFLPDLLKIVCELSCRLVVVGYSTSRRDNVRMEDVKRRLQEISHQTTCPFIFIGDRSTQDLHMSTVRAALDVVVVTSRSEGFGLTAAEALAFGSMPVVSSVGGLPEILEASSREGKVGFTYEVFAQHHLSVLALRLALNQSVSLLSQARLSGRLQALHDRLYAATPLRSHASGLPAYINMYSTLGVR